MHPRFFRLCKSESVTWKKSAGRIDPREECKSNSMAMQLAMQLATIRRNGRHRPAYPTKRTVMNSSSACHRLSMGHMPKLGVLEPVPKGPAETKTKRPYTNDAQQQQMSSHAHFFFFFSDEIDEHKKLKRGNNAEPCNMMSDKNEGKYQGGRGEGICDHRLPGRSQSASPLTTG